MKYFLTGATGFVGGWLARQLVEAGHQVVAVVRDPARAGDLAALGVDVRAGDVTDKQSLRAPMAGADGVFHVAGWFKVGVRDKSAAEPINVQGTRNVLELMQELSIPKGVYTSTLAINSDTHGRVVDETYRYDGPHVSEYDRTKWLAHYQVAEPMIARGLPLVIVMPGLVYGPNDTGQLGTFWRQYLRRRLPLVPEGVAYCLAHVDDIAQAHRLAMDKGRPGETYIIGGEPVRMTEVVALAEQLTGVKPPRLRASPGWLKAMSAVMGVVERIVPVPDDYSAEYLRVVAGVTYLGDNAKARRQLGYAPRPLAEGLAETLRHEMRLLGM